MKKKTDLASILIKPGISADGFRVAVRDYSERAVVEELAANSYDADATTALVILDGDYLHIIDDGYGFSLDAIKRVAILGAGEKAGADFSRGKRPYLGCYGFGLKSTLNIAKKVEIHTISKDGDFLVVIDWMQLEEGLKGDFQGFHFEARARRGRPTGSHIKLTLKTPLPDEHLDEFTSVLSNLPEDEGRFECYSGLSSKLKKVVSRVTEHFGQLRPLTRKLAKRQQLILADTSANADLRECQVQEIKDKEDPTVTAKFHFGGIEEGKVRPIKRGLRGIYLRINGRLLKQSFTDQKYVYYISKWVKFAAGLRAEISIDWLRNEISLSREGIRFSNPKLEEQFRAVLTRLVSGFIQPQLKKLERKAAKQAGQKYQQRLELAKKRIENHKSIRLPGSTANGFCFKPETDGELALIIAQKPVLKQVSKNLSLIDYNDQAPFDCLVFDSSRREFIQTELEPTLIEFLGHRDSSAVQMIITWSRGKWRIGAKKKGKSGFLQLNAEKGAKPGHYRLLEFSGANTKKARKHFPVVILEEVLS